MLRCLTAAVVVCCGSTSFAQTLEESIAAHDAAVQEARQKVIVKYQELIKAAVKKGDSAKAGRFREWSQFFAQEGHLHLPDEIKGTIKEYGASVKTAGDTLQDAYFKEIAARNQQKEYDAATSLSNELEARMLPTKLVSLQMFRSTNYFIHADHRANGGPARNDGERLNATFELRAGLADSEFTSIRAVNIPNSFVDHGDFRIRLTVFQNDEVWKRHATWMKVRGLANEKAGVSFKSATHPDRYIRIRANGEA